MQIVRVEEHWVETIRSHSDNAWVKWVNGPSGSCESKTAAEVRLKRVFLVFPVALECMNLCWQEQNHAETPRIYKKKWAGFLIKYLEVNLAEGNMSLTAALSVLAQEILKSKLLRELFWQLQLVRSDQEHMSGYTTAFIWATPENLSP